jgi:large subunit ribosomal protein L18e
LKRMITNQELLGTIRFLKVQAKENESKIWAVVAEELSRPHRTRAVLNLNHISRAATADSLVVVPGKVLAAGAIRHPVVVGAFQFSEAARMKIEQAGGKCIGIRDFVNKYPKGSKVQILK